MYVKMCALVSCKTIILIQGAFLKYCLHICIFNPDKVSKCNKSIKCSLDCVFSFYTLCFHVVLSFNTASSEQVFQTCQCRIFQAVLETIFPYQLGTSASCVKQLPLRCALKTPKNQKSDISKSGLWGGCGTTSNPMLSIAAEVAALVVLC